MHIKYKIIYYFLFRDRIDNIADLLTRERELFNYISLIFSKVRGRQIELEDYVNELYKDEG